VNLTLTYEHSRNRFEGTLHRFSDALGELVINQTVLRRKQNSFFGILKNRLDVEHKAFRWLDWDFSWRVDWPKTQRNIASFASLRPRQIESAGKSYLTYKFAFNGIGEIRNWRYTAYVTNGDNVKFPTLQQLFHFDVHAPEALQPPQPLDVEENIGTEAGCRLEEELANAPTFLRIRKIKIDFAVFRNSYASKIAEITNRASLPRPVNTQLAWIRGLESRLSVEFLRGAMIWEGAFLRLKISDPRIFRFKPEKKITTDLWFNWRGFSFNSHAFYEGEQTALILAASQPAAESTLPARWDVDLSLQKTLMSGGLSGFLNLGVRNLRNSGRSELSGFFLQDRRWYLSLGARI
jgi:hypothetical protein